MASKIKTSYFKQTKFLEMFKNKYMQINRLTLECFNYECFNYLRSLRHCENIDNHFRGRNQIVAVLAKMMQYRAPKRKNDLKETHTNSFTLVTKLVDINYIVIN